MNTLYKGQYTLNGILEMGRRGITVSQAKMSVTGNNIANINTKGYTRQRVEAKSSTPLQSMDLNFESGVVADSVRRMRDTFYDLQMRTENPSLARWDEESHQLGQVEAILNEPNAMGLSNQLNVFFKSWEDLATNPQDQSVRSVVRDSANSLNYTFNRIGNDLSNLSDELSDKIDDTTLEINFLIKEIADATKSIRSQHRDSEELSTMNDRRDLSLDKLSKLIDVSYEEKDDGNLIVYCNGIVVAQGTDYNQLQTKENQETHKTDLYWRNETTKAVINNGKMKGLLNTRDKTIPELEDKLNQVVKSLVENVNSVHNSNFNLEGTAGGDFFDSSGVTLNTIKISSIIQNDVKFIAASANAGALGNGNGALAMSEIADSNLMNNSTESIGEFYNRIVVETGTYKNEADRLHDAEKVFVNQLENKRNEVTEVDLDEELGNMIKFQQSYGAAAKVISSADKMMQQILAI